MYHCQRSPVWQLVLEAEEEFGAQNYNEHVCMHFFRYREADTNTGLVQAANVSVVESAPVRQLALQAEEKFKARAGDDQQLDAYELQHILNNIFAKSKFLRYFHNNMKFISKVNLNQQSQLGLSFCNSKELLGFACFSDCIANLKRPSLPVPNPNQLLKGSSTPSKSGMM